jgi:hypothetical protein
MVIAWLAMTIVAIYSARYMRNAWPHTTVMGLKIWFHVRPQTDLLKRHLFSKNKRFIER